MQGWIDLFRTLGESLIEVLRAETSALQTDLKTSGRHLQWALLFLGAAVLMSFWVVGLLVFLLVVALDVWLPLWLATLLVLAAFAGAMSVLGLLAWRRLRQVENPVDTLKRHMDDHLDWWQSGLLAQGRAMDIPPAVAADVEREELP